MTAMEDPGASGDRLPDREPAADNSPGLDREPITDRKAFLDQEVWRGRLTLSLASLRGLILRLLASLRWITPRVLAALRWITPRLLASLRLLAHAAVAIALVTALVSFMLVTTPGAPLPSVLNVCLWLNIAMIVVLVGIVVHQFLHSIKAGRGGRSEVWRRAGIIALFSILAALPTVAAAVMAQAMAERGFDRLFSTLVHEIIQDSRFVSKNYTDDHTQAIRGDILRMAADIVRTRPRIDSDRIALLSDHNRRALGEQLMAGIKTYSLSDAMIVDQDRSVLVQAGMPRFRLPEDGDRSVLVQAGIPRFRLPPAPDGSLNDVTDTEPQIAILPDGSTISAVLRLKASQNSFLYVVRQIDPRVLARLRQTEVSVQEYGEVKSRRAAMQDVLTLIFAVTVLAALSTNLIFANWVMRRPAGAAPTPPQPAASAAL
ncbi:MAG: hypothetical protein FWD68_01870 [Alphaproteobacteria bacterium]|nr:hypothetical protein [Alphaproteobacteria bacterium]